MTLNPHQQKAVQTTQGRVLILAGAGSGKTLVLTMRMVHLINHQKVPPSAILGLTFTNKAAAEMRHRVGRFVDPATAKQVTLSTFHSFCMQILRKEIHHLGYTPHFTLYNEKDIHRLVMHIARDELDRNGELPSLQGTLDQISHFRNHAVSEETITPLSNSWHDQFSAKVFVRLKESMRAYNAVDFDSLLSLTVELFEKHPALLESYQDRYRYIMIDEYQDTNPIQYRLAHLLAGKHHNLCVVGDDDQSIYGWRGADVRNILHFSDAVTIKLEENYRSTNTILNAANAVIAHNTERHAKSLWSSKGEGNPILLYHAADEVDEANVVAYLMDQMRQTHGYRWGDFAILYRSNALSRQFESSLMRYRWMEGNQVNNGIPYRIHGGVEFYERREVKDLIAYLKVIVNDRDQEAILRVINQPRRGIGETSLDALTQYNRKKNIPLWDVLEGVNGCSDEYAPLREGMNKKSLEGLADFIAAIKGARARFQTDSKVEAMKELVQRIDYQRAIKEEVKSAQMRAFKWENVKEFVSSMAEFEGSLGDFIGAMALNEHHHDDPRRSEENNQVTLMTFHSAKGLEFKVCFLVGVEDHIIPHEKSMQETGLQEERRLMYVAITRAMEQLIITASKKRKRMGQEVPSVLSRFVGEIPSELIQTVKI